MERLLVFTPLLPKLNGAAGAQDQIYGALRLQRMGHVVRMAALLPAYQSQADAAAYSRQIGLEIVTSPYAEPAKSPIHLGTRLSYALAEPALIDGAAYQHARRQVSQFAAEQIRAFRPDLVWLDNTFLWPLARLAREAGSVVVTRSQNYEPTQLLDESGRTPLNYLRAAAKYLGERAAVRYSDVVAAITPVEQEKYRRLTKTPGKIELLPLRGLPAHLKTPRPANKYQPLDVFYFGSSYNFSHNRTALEFTTQRIWPQVRAAAPGQFRLHIFGGKVPSHIQGLSADDLIIHGFVPSLEQALDDMDIALMPSLHGCGMQQKVFEPLCRGFPTITSPRGLAGYPFEAGKHVLTATTAEEYLDRLLELRDSGRRTELAQHASQLAAELFSEERQREAHQRILRRALGKGAHETHTN